LPSSRSISTAVAVNSFETEPSRKRVCGVTGTTGREVRAAVASGPERLAVVHDRHREAGDAVIGELLADPEVGDGASATAATKQSARQRWLGRLSSRSPLQSLRPRWAAETLRFRRSPSWLIPIAGPSTATRARTARPGFAPVWMPSRITAVPFTNSVLDTDRELVG
jgi:hypothetical protein